MTTTSRIISPNSTAEVDDDIVRYSLPADEDGETSRFVGLHRNATLGGYFDDMFSRALTLTSSRIDPASNLLSHGLNCLWCFTANSYARTTKRLSETSDRVSGLEQQIDELKAEIQQLRRGSESA